MRRRLIVSLLLEKQHILFRFQFIFDKLSFLEKIPRLAGTKMNFNILDGFLVFISIRGREECLANQELVYCADNYQWKVTMHEQPFLFVFACALKQTESKMVLQMTEDGRFCAPLTT